ncbi:S8 family serine peptidase [Granulicella sibirica]|uniref:S8 family serine peptidase n=1 Tax=Granulicella sibirica TaxID=2479048 RepID=UPI001375DE48|nr:S8 family serine peptidase [Granulicella sibirica]
MKSETDLPRFSYPISGTASELLVADDAVFLAFARKVGADVDGLLAGYAIDDKATLRGLLGTKVDVQLLTGDVDGGLATLDKVRDLEEKPQTRVSSGLITREILKAEKDSGAASGPAFQAAFAKEFKGTVDGLPWAAVQDRVKQSRAQYSTLTPDVLIGSVKASMDPAVTKTKSLDFRMAQSLVLLRTVLKDRYPVKETIVNTLAAYIKTNNAAKPDIWAARDVSFGSAATLTPVLIGIWDSGVDTSLYPGQLYVDPKPGMHSPHGLAFDQQGKLYNGDLQPLSAEQKAFYPRALEIRRGRNDMVDGIDSPLAAKFREDLKTTPPDQLAAEQKTSTFLSQWMHGTHVAGIAVKGNPAARLVVAQFDDGIEYLPFAPTVEWANTFKADFVQIGDYFREHHVRVVNMSWSDSQSEFEDWLAKASTEKDPSVRKQMAAQVYAIWREAVEGAIKRAPETLFVCAAGNSDSNPGFNGDVPASLILPNLITVGAVDQAGDETSFTSYGTTVVLDADGFQVESFVPGGTRLKESGTSMASPNVVNLAAKLFALDPSLTPEKAIALMEKGADASPDGRRHLINPKATVAMLQSKTP